VSYEFREASTPADYDQIRRLNHLVFAGELGQHQPNPAGLLVDKHEAHSRFFIALHAGRVVGMVCCSSLPPFSIESRLNEPAILQGLPGPLLEARLLAIHPDHRNRMVFAGVLTLLAARSLEAGYATLLISGLESRVEMYERMGFRPLGPPVPSGQAAFVPMALNLSELPERYVRRASSP
jgi:hypothetical protein